MMRTSAMPAAHPARERSILASFDRIAKPYRWMEHLTFGRALWRCRTHFLPNLTDSRNALILGDGDGRFTAELLATNRSVHVDAVDSSAAMLRLLSHRTANARATTRLRTHHADALNFVQSLPANTRYDLVVTHFFLDCLTQPETDSLAEAIAPHLQPGALWLISDFRIPSGAMRWPARALIRSLYLGFRILTGLRTMQLPDHAAALTAAGLTRVAQHLSLVGILTSECWTTPPGVRSSVNFSE